MDPRDRTPTSGTILDVNLRQDTGRRHSPRVPGTQTSLGPDAVYTTL